MPCFASCLANLMAFNKHVFFCGLQSSFLRGQFNSSSTILLLYHHTHANAIHYALCVIFMILVSPANVKKCVLGGCTIIVITSKTKIAVFWNLFSLSRATPSVRNFFKKTSILAFEANSALSRENETKIVKITYSDYA